MDNQSIDRLMAAGWDDVYHAETARRVAYHVTAPRWNLRAPPTTRMGRFFSTLRAHKYFAECAHGHARGFAIATSQICFRNS
jgi:hypothetical protein